MSFIIRPVLLCVANIWPSYFRLSVPRKTARFVCILTQLSHLFLSKDKVKCKKNIMYIRVGNYIIGTTFCDCGTLHFSLTFSLII